MSVSALNLHIHIPWKDVRRMIMAYLNGVDVLMIRMAHNRRLESTLPQRKYLCSNIAGHGYLELLKWTHENGCIWDIQTTYNTAFSGHLEILRYISTHTKATCANPNCSGPCPWNASVCAYAAHGGHFEVLQYAHDNGCPWDKWTVHFAAERGHLEILQYAHENKCPWDASTCKYAAFSGQLEVLKWAHENGCPWDEWTCEYAADRGHLEVLQYAHANGCPYDKDYCRRRAAEGRHQHVVDWLTSLD